MTQRINAYEPQPENPAAARRFRRNARLSGSAIAGGMVLAMSSFAVSSYFFPLGFIVFFVGFGGLGRIESEKARLLDATALRPARLLSARNDLDDEHDPIIRARLEVPHENGSVYEADVVIPRDARCEAYAKPGAFVLVKVHPCDPAKIFPDLDETFRQFASSPDLNFPRTLGTVSLKCTQCSANLEPLAGRRSIICNYCNSENHVVRT